jgi:alkanesulfonate monooxygenase SsuD/methylene tetrahydromethanopterin reductase-like flavin-dependent oxidoreductase (luciferase family)
MSAESENQAGAWETHPWVADGAGRPRFGVAYGPRADWPATRDFAQAAEGLGFDSYWSYDHPLLGRDCWPLLTAVALATSTIRLGTLVNCVAYRHPALLARLAADVDDLSGGRLVLGLGIGDFAFEFARLGLPFAPVPQRQAALEEAARIVTGLLWTDQPVTVRGAHFAVEEAVLYPPPTRRPRIPLLIAGGGERVTLRQVARHADAANFGQSRYGGAARTLDDVRRKHAALQRHCDDLGRPYETVLRCHTTFYLVLATSPDALRAKVDRLPPLVRQLSEGSLVAATPGEAIAYFRDLAAAGVAYFIAAIYGDDVETVRLLTEEVIPAVINT